MWRDHHRDERKRTKRLIFALVPALVSHLFYFPMRQKQKQICREHPMGTTTITKWWCPGLGRSPSGVLLRATARQHALVTVQPRRVAPGHCRPLLALLRIRYGPVDRGYFRFGGVLFRRS
jgi:hypothetical protein